MDNFEIGRRIESRRKELGLTLDDIASAIGVAGSTIQRYERGRIDKLKLPVLEAIARELRVNAGWLLGVEPIVYDPDGEAKQLPESEELSQSQKDLIALVSSLPEETCQAVLLLLRQQFPPDAPDGG